MKKRSDDIALFDLTVSYSGIEHDGLGRYGDPINPEGDISAMREMWLLTRPGGILLVRYIKSIYIVFHVWSVPNENMN